MLQLYRASSEVSEAVFMKWNQNLLHMLVNRILLFLNAWPENLDIMAGWGFGSLHREIMGFLKQMLVEILWLVLCLRSEYTNVRELPDLKIFESLKH